MLEHDAGVETLMLEHDVRRETLMLEHDVLKPVHVDALQHQQFEASDQVQHWRHVDSL